MQNHEVKLVWVLVHEELHHCSEYSHLPPQNRPDAICPVCRELVTLKLGSKKIHHFAHRSDSKCPARLPEGALHCNTKFYLATWFRRTTRLTITKPCIGVEDGWEECAKTRTANWISGWSDVRVEYTLDPIKPDIVLLYAGRPIAVIEVFATHSVTEEKTAVLRRMGCRWIEIEAKESLYGGEKPWTPSDPLMVKRSSEQWRCPECAQILGEKKRAIAKQKRRQEQMKALASCTARYFKVVDFYYPPKNKKRCCFREIFIVAERIQEDGTVLNSVLLSRSDGKVLASASMPLGETAWKILTSEYDRVVNAKSRAIIHSPMEWFDCRVSRMPEWSNSKQFPGDHLDQYPACYRWNPKDQRWFKPSHFENVRWYPDDKQVEREAQAERIRDADRRWQNKKIERQVNNNVKEKQSENKRELKIEDASSHFKPARVFDQRSRQEIEKALHAITVLGECSENNFPTKSNEMIAGYDEIIRKLRDWITDSQAEVSVQDLDWLYEQRHRCFQARERWRQFGSNSDWGHHTRGV